MAKTTHAKCVKCRRRIAKDDPRIVIAGHTWCPDCVYRAEKRAALRFLETCV